VLICLYSVKVTSLEKISIGTQKDEDSIDFCLLGTQMSMHGNFSIFLDTFLYKKSLGMWIGLTGFRHEVYFKERDVMKSGGEMEWRTR
jgi:hypothetical protein